MTTSLKLKKWDVVDHLRSGEDMGLYLEACFEEDPGDGSLIRAALGDLARARGMARLARETGLSREGLYKALSPEGNPEFSTVVKVIRALGLKVHAAEGRGEGESAGMTAAAGNAPMDGAGRLPPVRKRTRRGD